MLIFLSVVGFVLLVAAGISWSAWKQSQWQPTESSLRHVNFRLIQLANLFEEEEGRLVLTTNELTSLYGGSFEKKVVDLLLDTVQNPTVRFNIDRLCIDGIWITGVSYYRRKRWLKGDTVIHVVLSFSANKGDEEASPLSNRIVEVAKRTKLPIWDYQREKILPKEET